MRLPRSLFDTQFATFTLILITFIKLIVQTGNKMNFKVTYLMQMLSISDEDHLQTNLQIVKKLLITNQDYALNIVHPLTDQFLKGLYLRCLTLVWKVVIINLN